MGHRPILSVPQSILVQYYQNGLCWCVALPIVPGLRTSGKSPAHRFERSAKPVQRVRCYPVTPTEIVGPTGKKKWRKCASADHVKNEGHLRAIVALLSTPQECSTRVPVRAKLLQTLEKRMAGESGPHNSPPTNFPGQPQLMLAEASAGIRPPAGASQALRTAASSCCCRARLPRLDPCYLCITPHILASLKPRRAAAKRL